MSNQDILEKGQRYVMNTYARYPLALVKGDGCWVYDADNRCYLDFGSGIAVTGLGHANEELAKALFEQAEKIWHCSNLYWIEPQVRLAESLVEASGLGRAFFCNSGAEANEAAIKLARKYFCRKGENRFEIVTFNQSFHGRTMGSLSATGQDKYHQGFAPLTPGFVRAEFDNLKSVEKVIGPSTAAVLVEPVQGEGGIHPASFGFLKGLRELCDDQGILLIFDEVQTGMGRTGKIFAFEHYGVKPNILTLAKGLGGGFPIGAMLADEGAASGFAPGDHASTFGGNPLACAVACRVMDMLTAPGFMEKVRENADYLKAKLDVLKQNCNTVKEIRGLGFMLGLELECEAGDVIKAAMKEGLLVLSAGPKVLRLTPPLIAEKREIDQAVAILKKVLS